MLNTSVTPVLIFCSTGHSSFVNCRQVHCVATYGWFRENDTAHSWKLRILTRPCLICKWKIYTTYRSAWFKRILIRKLDKHKSSYNFLFLYLLLNQSHYWRFIDIQLLMWIYICIYIYIIYLYSLKSRQSDIYVCVFVSNFFDKNSLCITISKCHRNLSVKFAAHKLRFRFGIPLMVGYLSSSALIVLCCFVIVNPRTSTPHPCRFTACLQMTPES
jgi:hypothetical protein